MSFIRAVSAISSLTLLSRIFGFLRDMLVARYLGAGLQSDAFLVAFKLPNFLRRLFAEGAFNAAFVPMFSGALEEQGRPAARRMAEDVFAVLAMILLLVVALAEIFMPAIVSVFAPGFAEDPAKFDLTVFLARICFPYILLIALVTLLGAMLNSLNRFAAVAAAPVLLNLCLIGCLLLLSVYTQTPAHALSIGVMLAGIVQFGWLVLICRKARVNLRIKWPKLTSDVKKLLYLAAPVALGAGVAQVNLLINTILASAYEGAVSWLYYADRLNELPIGIIGVAVGTALLPMLTRAIRSGNEEEAMAQFNLALVFALAFAIPACVALVILADPLVRCIYEYGEFNAVDRSAVVPALVAVSCGLPAFVMTKVFAPGFFAREDTKTPVKVAMVTVVVNIVCALLLRQDYQHVGLAMAVSIAAWVNALLMMVILFRRQLFQPSKYVMIALGKVIVAAVLMAVVLLLLLPNLGFASLGEKTLSMAVLVAVGLASYFITILGLRLHRYPGFMQSVKQRALK